MFADRQSRLRVLEALDARAKQFRSREDSWPFRMPHEPLDLDELIERALAGGDGRVPPDALRARSVMRFEWATGDLWELWVAALPSGLHLYCDTDGHETRVLASARRGNPSDADGFFLERLAESRGHLFGIEMAGAPPDRVKSAIGDRDFLADVFVELFEGAEAERALAVAAPADAVAAPADAVAAPADFHAVVVQWLGRVLTAPPMTRRQPRVREEDPAGL